MDLEFFNVPVILMGVPSGTRAAEVRDAGSIPGSGRFPWRRAWQPTPVFLPGKSHGQRSLVDYSPWGPKRVGHILATKQRQK